MDKYVEVCNDDNIVQINDYYENIFYHSKSNPVFSNTYECNGYISRALIRVPTHYAFWFLYNNSDKEIEVGMGKSGMSGGVFNRYLLFRSEKEAVTKEFIENNIELYWFSIGNTQKKGNYGIEIYSKKNKLIFSSAQNYLRIAEHFSFVDMWDKAVSENLVNWGGNANKKYAIHMGSSPSSVFYQGQWHYFDQMFAVIGAKNKYIRSKWHSWEETMSNDRPEDDEYTSVDYEYSAWTIADITGL